MDKIVCPNCHFEFNPQPEGIISQYVPPKERKVELAVPKLSAYREKFKGRKLSIKDVKAPASEPRIVKTDSELDRFSYRGEGLFTGPGVEIEI